MEINQAENKKMLLKEYEALLALKEDYPKGIKSYEMDNEIYRLGLSSIHHDIRSMAEKMLEEKKPRKITHIKNNVAKAAEHIWDVNNNYGDDVMEGTVIISKLAALVLLMAAFIAKEPQMQVNLLSSVLPTIFLPGLFVVSVGMSIEMVTEFIQRHLRVDFESQREAIYQSLTKAFNQYIKNKDSEQFKNKLDTVLHDDKNIVDSGFTK